MADSYAVVMAGKALRVFANAGNAERFAEGRASEIAMARAIDARNQIGRAVASVVRSGTKSVAAKRVEAIMDLNENILHVNWRGWRKGRA